MKTLILSFLLFHFNLSLAQQSITGKVIDVHDGDTFNVLTNNGKVKIRMAGIDAPEFSPKSKLIQNYGLQSQIYII